jgi:tetratricopeptide (TPR) repeat protein
MQYYQDGNKLMTTERYPEAIEQYRNALSVSHSSRDRLALAQALEKAGRPAEAEVYFREVLRDNHDSGPANLGLGHVAADRGDVPEAIDNYHRAIYGSWPDQRKVHQVQARIELVQILGKFGKRQEARSELLALEAEIPDDAALREQLGRLLLDYGLPQESAGVFRKVIEKDRRDENALMGLGEAELAQNRYTAAQNEFKAALRVNPGDANAASRLQLVERILAVDPAARGLSPRERYERSRKLVEAALGSLHECLGTTKGATPGPVKALSDAARKLLLRPAKGGGADENIALSEQLWDARTGLCGPSKTPDDPLSRMMAQLARERH